MKRGGKEVEEKKEDKTKEFDDELEELKVHAKTKEKKDKVYHLVYIHPSMSFISSHSFPIFTPSLFTATNTTPPSILYRVAQKERNSRYSRFSGLCSNQQLLSSLCWIEHLFPIIITSRSSNLVENFLFYETFLMGCHFRDLPDFQSFEARWQIKWQIPKMTVDKKLLIK